MTATARSAWWIRLAPSVGLSLGVAAAILLAAPAWWRGSVELVLLYLATPVAKEAWLLLAEARLGLPTLFAGGLLLLVNAALALFCLTAVPVEAATRRFPRLARALERRREAVAASPLARRSLAAALAVALLLPFHSGGTILGALAGPLLGLSARVTFVTVVSAAATRLGVVALAAYGVSLVAA